MGATSLTQTIDARIATLTADVTETLRRNPGGTIVPHEAAADSRKGRALELLTELGASRPDALRVERTLGEGGMGVVHLAEQRSMGRRVAVKTLKPDHRDPESALRLLREAWITGSLEHPNVVPVYDVALDGSGTPQVVLKRIEGVDWASLLADAQALRERAEGDVEAWNVRTLMQVCNAISFAHARGVIHRDLKPENVMIGPFGEVYVVDWGIAVSLREDDNPRLPRVSTATDLAGTPLYMAPEMLVGDPTRLGEWTDVYLIGAMLFEIATGRPPHDGPTLEAIFARILRSPPDVPSSVPAELRAICTRAMAAAPEGRYASVAELRRALGDYLEHRESMRLARGAQGRLGQLLEELRAARDEPEDGQDIHYLFGECRAGFRAALDAWKDNEVARGGLTLAVEAMAAHEIASGNLAAARRLIAELGGPHRDLRQGLVALEAKQATDSARRRELEALDRELDPTIGSRTRTFLALLMGVLWTGLPLVTHFVMTRSGVTPQPMFSAATALGSLPVVLGVGYWARESLMKTALNRRSFALIVFTLAAQAVLGSSMALARVEPRTAVSLDFFLWFTAAGLGAITIERRIWPTSAGYLVAFFAALARPDLLLLVMSASHAVLTVNAVSIWLPLWRGGGKARAA